MHSYSQSPNDPAFVQNPYPFYDRTRATGPLFYWEEYKMVCATSHELVMSLLKDRRFGREVPPEAASKIPERLKPFYDIEAHSMLELEPPRHTRLRGLVLRAFTSRRIKEMAPEIDALCHQLIDRFPAGPFDLLEHYARIVPVVVICRLLGVPEDRADDLLRWSNAMVAMYMANRSRETENAAVDAALAFTDFIKTHIDTKRSQPGDDLISSLIAAKEDNARLSTEELITTCILLLNAGHEATVHTMGNGIATLLAKGLSEIDANAVEEILRFDPPLHMFTRWAYEDVTIQGHRFRRGDQLACLLAAGNRDPSAYANPNLFDPSRTGPMNTSFGGGIHFCVGAPLARLEMLIGMQVLFQRCPSLHLTQPPHYGDVYHFHGLERLMVSL